MEWTNAFFEKLQVLTRTQDDIICGRSGGHILYRRAVITGATLLLQHSDFGIIGFHARVSCAPHSSSAEKTDHNKLFGVRAGKGSIVWQHAMEGSLVSCKGAGTGCEQHCCNSQDHVVARHSRQ